MVLISKVQTKLDKEREVIKRARIDEKMKELKKESPGVGQYDCDEAIKKYVLE